MPDEQKRKRDTFERIAQSIVRSAGNLDDAINNILQTFGTVDVDPLYEHVRYIGDTAVLIKKRSSAEEVTREVEALDYWAKQNGFVFDYPSFNFPLLPVEDHILMPYVGPEVYDVYNLLNTKIDELNKDTSKKKEGQKKIIDLVGFRRALVLRQIDLLANSISYPYIPTKLDGSVIVENRDVVGTYISNIKQVIMDNVQEGSIKIDTTALSSALSVFHELLNAESPQRYIDTYARNIGFRVPERKRGEVIGATLDNILKLRNAYQSLTGTLQTPTPALDEEFLQREYRLVQFDLHRHEKIALSGECLANIIHDPRLLDVQSEYKFGVKEQNNAIARYLLLLTYIEEFKKETNPDRNKIRRLLDEIEATNEGNYTLDKLKSLGNDILPFDTAMHVHYLTMFFYKAMRWYGYVNNHYLQRYNAILADKDNSDTKKQVVKYRKELYEKDLSIYARTAKNYLEELMKILYNQLDKTKTRKIKKKHWKYIELNSDKDEKHRTQYFVKSRENKYSFLYGKKKREINLQRFVEHKNKLQYQSDAKQDDEIKLYKQLLCLSYLAQFLP